VPWGVHLLDPGELEWVLPYRGTTDKFYVTVPFTLSDRRAEVWEKFFKEAESAKITPLLRLVTKFDNKHWTIPSRQDIVSATSFLTALPWSGERYIILFNETNRAEEWGGKIDPEGYARIAWFSLQWLKTEPVNYVVLPAGLDAAAPNNHVLLDSFRYIERMYRAEPELFRHLDGWTSHAYPNPDFTATVHGTGKASIRGFETEQAYLQRLTGVTFAMYITETGWRQTYATTKKLGSYYDFAVKHIWQQPMVKAVTVFLFKGHNGPFASFSLLNSENEPTPAMSALLKAVK
jgi:hypothetical protein